MMDSVQINPLKGMAIVLVAIVVPFYFFVSCSGDKKEMVEVTFDPETSYTLKETNVETLISDSGVTKIKMITDTWLIFGRASEPYWYFPDGIYLEKFDTAFNVEVSIQADTAHYFQRRNLWQADGNVDILNTDGVRLETSQLFWDRNKETFYSDSFVKITKGEDVNTGIGFLSNKDMSEYKIFNSTANFAVEMLRHGQETDSIPADSASNNETNLVNFPENVQDTIIPSNPQSSDIKEKE
jgi:LPS export ABC transporter protein LptC